MHRRFALPMMTLLVAFLIACSGTATNTPSAVAPTQAPTTAPTTAALTTAVARIAPSVSQPIGTVVTSGAVAATAPTAATGSIAAATATRPALSATTGPTPAAASAPAVVGTRPANSVLTGSAITGTTTAGSAVTGTVLTPFTDPQGRFTFSRPAAWTVGQSTAPSSAVQFNSTNPAGVVDISTEAYPSAATPNTILTAAFAEIKKGIPDAQEVGTATLQLGSEPAVQIDYTGTVSGDIRIYFSQIFALHAGTLYILTLGAPPADIEKMKQQAIPLVTTWKFLQ